MDFTRLLPLGWFSGTLNYLRAKDMSSGAPPSGDTGTGPGDLPAVQGAQGQLWSLPGACLDPYTHTYHQGIRFCGAGDGLCDRESRPAGNLGP